MKGLNNDLKNQSFSQIYLLYGSEDYLKRSYKNSLSAAICETSDTMNYSYYEGKGIAVPNVIDTAETLPFFKDRRLIVIENSGFFKNACEELADYLKEPCETTYFIFVESEVDKRSKMFKAVQKLGRCVEMVSPDEDMLLNWAVRLIDKAGKKIRRSTLLRLFNRSGTDMNTLSMEISKLIDYLGDREVIEDNDIDEICTLEIKNQIFDMVDAITDGKSKKALDMYYSLLALREPPLRILFLIARQFNILLQVKMLASKITDPKLIASQLSMAPFVVIKCLKKVRNYHTSYLKSAIEECVSLEEAVKTGQLEDKISVELLIVKYSKKA